MTISDLIITDKQQVSLNDIFLEETNKKQLTQFVREHRHIQKLQEYNLAVNNKILLFGSSGCGKTTTAKAIANAVGKNIMILNLSNVICARIGETSQNIKMIFDKAAREKAVLFLDEFDQIGKVRSIDDKDVGEMRRLVNTIIQLIDYYPEDAILICATNHESFIDPAIVRRFQLRMGFQLPTNEVLDLYYDQLLARFPGNLQQINRVYGFSFAEAKDYALTTVKSVLIDQIEQQKDSHL